MKNKFKAGDLVENTHTGEIELVHCINYFKDGYYLFWIVQSLNSSNELLFMTAYPLDNYRKISSKKITFNLK
jgi:hypothetical protein